MKYDADLIANNNKQTHLIKLVLDCFDKHYVYVCDAQNALDKRLSRTILRFVII